MATEIEKALDAAATAIGPSCHLVIYRDELGALTVGVAEGTPDIEALPAWVDEADAKVGGLLAALRGELRAIADVATRVHP